MSDLEERVQRRAERLKAPRSRPEIPGLEDYIARFLATAPPLTAEQIAVLRPLLNEQDK